MYRGSNRTLLELKYINKRQHIIRIWFQSYITGIEIGDDVPDEANMACSNRTLLELKFFI